MISEERNFKRKKRRRRVENISDFGLMAGKLYKFCGRFRKVYQSSKPHLSSYEERLSSYRIKKNDHVIFFKADLWHSSVVRRWFSTAKGVDKNKKTLLDKGFSIIKIEPYSINRRYRIKPPAAASHYYIHYHANEKKYSGRLYIGHGEKFGWINIVQLTKEQILNQFEKVDTGKER